MGDRYILDERGEPVPELDPARWVKWFDSNRARMLVARDSVGDAEVSTTFLGVDHSSGDAPVLWWTIVLGGALDRTGDRCAGSREQAEAMHAKMVERVKKSQS